MFIKGLQDSPAPWRVKLSGIRHSKATAGMRLGTFASSKDQNTENITFNAL